MRKLPKDIVGFKFDKLFAVEMNEYEPEMALPGLFYLIRSRGRERGGLTEATDTLHYASLLSQHDCAMGFSDDVGLRLAHKWSRTSFASIGRRGRSRDKGEQITYLYPLSFLTYKPSFPSQSSRHRNVHRFLFDLMFRASGQHVSWGDVVLGKAETEPPLAALLRQAFSRGILLSPGKDLEGAYDGKTPLDTEVLASTYYLDGFKAVQPNPKKFPPLCSPALPAAARSVVRDLQCFVAAYAPRMPTLVLANHLVALIALELATYTLRLVSATNESVELGTAPGDMACGDQSGADHLNLYCDLTEDRRSTSAELAGLCVGRDLEGIEHFFRASLTLRTLDRFAGSSDLRDRFETLQGPAYLLTLAELREDLYVKAQASVELRRIQAAWSADDTEEQGIALQEEERGLSQSDFDRLMDVLVAAQRRRGVENYIKWYRSTCGLGKEYGLLTGSLRSRSTWRYALSHSLLETLVQLCVVLPEYRPFSGMRPGRELTTQLEPMPVLLSDFLRFLRARFGILVDRPPDFRQDSEALQAAKTNLAALRERLRQMGLFVDLSDDFNAQYIYPRFKSRIRDLEAEEAEAVLQGSDAQ